LNENEDPAIQQVLIVGAGWVGRQIAARLAACGIQVGLTDRDGAIIQDAIQWIDQVSCDEAGELVQQAGFGRPERALTESVRPFETFEMLTAEALEAWDCQLVIECVPEQLSLKKRVLRRIGDLTPQRCIIASNSSYFVASVLSQFVTSPERFAQMHFHVPVLRQSVIDIVGCAQTNPEVLQRLSHLSQRIGQHPLLLRKEHPGYVFNWLLQSVLKAALELVALDVVDIEDVDRSWKAVTGMPLGPFGMMDQIGLDVIEQVLSNARWADPPKVSDQQLLEILRPLTRQGRLGTKTGSGFYEYRSTDAGPP
jgi:3-hydroxybutyryl-CoA dehydrogenase